MEKATIKSCIARIDDFDKRCEEEEYTDTDEAWDLLNGIRDDLRSLVGE